MVTVDNVLVFYRAAAMPVTFRLLDERIKADTRVTRFILPIGTINMDGTAMFLSVAVCFLAQINNIPLTIGDIITLGSVKYNLQFDQPMNPPEI